MLAADGSNAPQRPEGALQPMLVDRNRWAAGAYAQMDAAMELQLRWAASAFGTRQSFPTSLGQTLVRHRPRSVRTRAGRPASWVPLPSRTVPQTLREERADHRRS